MQRLVLLLAYFFAFVWPANATILYGVVQYRNVEGRIGVRISHSGKVARVHPGSPAAEAGLKEGDVITAVDGRRGAVEHIHGIPGTVVSLTVQRADQELTFDVPRVEFTDIRYKEQQ